jgi:hypothetical protein
MKHKTITLILSVLLDIENFIFRNVKETGLEPISICWPLVESKNRTIIGAGATN